MGHPLVVHCKKDKYDIYGGRGPNGDSRLWNKWSHLPDSLSEFKVSTRKESIDKFNEDFIKRYKEDDEFRSFINSLRGKVLGCWCSPKRCHLDIVAETANGVMSLL